MEAMMEAPKIDTDAGEMVEENEKSRGAAEDAELTPLDLVEEGVVARHEPIRCFEGTGRPHEAFWVWRNATDGGSEPEMELYGYISEYSWLDDDVTPKMFKDQLWEYGNGGPVTIRMNSGGGDVIAASVMKATLIDYPGRVTVKIDGLAASAATILAIAGDRVLMNESAYFMIHDPMAVFMLAALNIEELKRLLDSLQTAKSGIVDAYQTKTGLSREALGRMMARETWMTAQEAKENGFIDEVITAKGRKRKAGVNNSAAIINTLVNYRNVPEGLMARYEDNPDEGKQQAIEADPQVARLRAEAKLLKKE